MVNYQPETRGVLVVGTHGKQNIWKALNNVFSDALHLRCDIHLKDNVKQKLSELAIDSKAAREITNDIFGCNLDGVREGGLVDCKSEKFHSALNEVNKRWPILHNNAKHFLPYFVIGTLANST